MDSLRILVLGDSGVGKSTFLKFYCDDNSQEANQSTVGCFTAVKMLAGSVVRASNEPQVYIEFVEVAGRSKYEKTRDVFYKMIPNLEGVIFMHDLTSKNSLKNLKKWAAELLQTISRGSESSNTPDFENSTVSSLSVSGGRSIPVLVIGTKLDEMSQKEQTDKRVDLENVSNDSLSISLRNGSVFSQGSPALSQLHGFFQRAMNEKKRNSERNSFVSSMGGGGGGGGGVGRTTSSSINSNFISPFAHNTTSSFSSATTSAQQTQRDQAQRQSLFGTGGSASGATSNFLSSRSTSRSTLLDSKKE